MAGAIGAVPHAAGTNARRATMREAIRFEIIRR